MKFINFDDIVSKMKIIILTKMYLLLNTLVIVVLYEIQDVVKLIYFLT